MRDTTRFENVPGAAFQFWNAKRGWPSIKATLRLEVMGEEPWNDMRTHQPVRVRGLGRAKRGLVRRALARERPAGPPPTITTS